MSLFEPKSKAELEADELFNDQHGKRTSKKKMNKDVFLDEPDVHSTHDGGSHADHTNLRNGNYGVKPSKYPNTIVNIHTPPQKKKSSATQADEKAAKTVKIVMGIIFAWIGLQIIIPFLAIIVSLFT